MESVVNVSECEDVQRSCGCIYRDIFVIFGRFNFCRASHFKIGGSNKM